MTDSSSTSIAASGTREIVFIDSRVQDPSSLLKGLAADVKVVYIDARQDGLAQMTAALGEAGSYSAVHVLAHGSEGQLWLGNTFLDSHALAAKVEALAALGKGLAPGGDLLVYACDLGRGEAGAQFVSTLAQLTGADVAASNDRTGAGGDWELEITSGAVQAAPLALQDGDYAHALATLTVTNGNDSGAGSLRKAIYDAMDGDTITFSAGMTVTLTGRSLSLYRSLSIDGDLDNDGKADVTIDADHSGSIFVIQSNSTLDGLEMKNGLVSGRGGDGD